MAQSLLPRLYRQVEFADRFAMPFLVCGAGQQLTDLARDLAAERLHLAPEALNLGAQAVVVPAQPVIICLKLGYVPGQRPEHRPDVWTELLGRFCGFLTRHGLIRHRLHWRTGPICSDHVHMAARLLPLIDVNKPLTLFSVGRICRPHASINSPRRARKVGEGPRELR